MRAIICFFSVALLAACASKPLAETPDARKDLEERYSKKIGTATKQDLAQEFGTANWCRQNPSGEETCRFYKKIGMTWQGDKKDRTHYEQFDEIVAEFDSNGILKGYKANAQR